MIIGARDGLFIINLFCGVAKKGARPLDFLNTVLQICGMVSIVGGAGAIIFKLVRPAVRLNERVGKLEEHTEKDYRRLVSLEEMQKQQSKSLAALLNHQITGNGVEAMKKIRDELMESIIDN